MELKDSIIWNDTEIEVTVSYDVETSTVNHVKSIIAKNKGMQFVTEEVDLTEIAEQFGFEQNIIKNFNWDKVLEDKKNDDSDYSHSSFLD